MGSIVEKGLRAVPERTSALAGELAVVLEAPLRVVLAGLPPVYAHGLRIGLQAAGIPCSVVPDVAAVAASAEEPLPVVVVLPHELALPLLPVLTAGGGCAVVLVLPASTPEAFSEALRSGATGMIGAESELEDVVAVVRAAARKQTLLPRSVARALCRPSSGPAPVLSDRERSWLRRLAARSTVASLARSSGYSDREMYRLLAGVYSRLGAGNRTQALLQAQRWGLLDDEA